MMNRRLFLKLGAASSCGAAWALVTGCEAGTEALTEPETPDAGLSAHDGSVLYQDSSVSSAPDAASPPDAGTADAGEPDAGEPDAGLGPPYTIHAAFSVILNDSTCSKHSHDAFVAAGTYSEDRPIHFLGGSHELVFWVSELVRLQSGERVPYATIGAGPGHGHCGTAWRLEVGPPEPHRPDQCVVRGTAMCLP